MEGHCKVLSKDGLDFAFKEWVMRWHRCIATNGSYFKKEHVPVDAE